MGYYSGFCKLLVIVYLVWWLPLNETGEMENMFNIQYWRCILKRSYTCPHNDIKFYLYSVDNVKSRIHVRSKLALKISGFDPHKKNVIIIHGFNGSHESPPLKILRKAHTSLHEYNVFMVEWHTLGRFPCYLSALSNMKLVAQCSAQLYAYIMDYGGLARKTTCIGHSLGAHICGMMSNHLDVKQYKIVGLDPARPLIDRFSNQQFRVTRNDAHQVQIIHTNAGLLGETGVVGHVDFCINGGRMQPGCKGHMIKRSRCSHFQSVCYYAQALEDDTKFHGYPCDASCPKMGVIRREAGSVVPMGPNVPLTVSGQYCITINHNNECKFN